MLPAEMGQRGFELLTHPFWLRKLIITMGFLIPVSEAAGGPLSTGHVVICNVYQ